MVPLLQERGIVRSEYSSTTLRGHLGLPVPENRYTRARRERAVPLPCKELPRVQLNWQEGIRHAR